MGSVVVEGATVDDGIAIMALITEDVGAETDAYETFEAVDGFEPLLLLFPLGFSILCLVFLGGGLTISGSDFPFLKSIHCTQDFGNKRKYRTK
ncbi:hypothetical protein QL285_082648 [Trifolium repens]|nr:hypothetical protein QL285_082648 [Trifolium repens]